MASRAKAFAAYTNDVYAQYDARIESVIANSRIGLSAAGGDIDFSTVDIETAVMLIFMQIAQDAQEDMREILAEMEAARQAKERLREAQQRLKDRLKDFEDEAAKGERDNGEAPPIDPCAAVDTDLAVQMMLMAAAKQSDEELQALADEVIVIRERRKLAKKLESLRDERDALDELDEMEQLRLQILLDRRSKLMSALSNILKKMSETQEAIVANLK